MSNFLDRAAKLGHDIEKLKAGMRVCSLLEIKTPEEYRDLFAGHFTNEQRIAYGNGMRSKAPEEIFHSSDPQFFKQLFEYYVYGNGTLGHADQQMALKMFPMQIIAESDSDLTLTSSVTYTSSIVLNYATLTFDGGSIISENAVLGLNVDTIAFGDDYDTVKYHIGVLGAVGDTGSTGATGTTTSGQAASGSNSKPKSPGICTGAHSGGTGATGAAGGDGGEGGQGGNGYASDKATITVTTSFANPNNEELVVYTQSGAGGQGGTGGAGGAGQQGGNGGNGCNSGAEGTNGGSGGAGGVGGYGGTGGNGGVSVDGNDIYISVPSAYLDYVSYSSDTTAYGAPGSGGAGGAGGAGGSGGDGGHGCHNGADGATGDAGNSGANGNAGTTLGNPGTIYLSAYVS
ncbi:MAG: hypothetical protein HQL78_02465 [Magnetococcales bacterium]|nr:hypothetical protein [Magnetococcales bacterium]